MNSNLGPMFHGTVHPFKEGDVVEPRNGNPAYATPDLEYAIQHAGKREDVEYNRVAASGKPEDHAKAALITGKVFQVEPLDSTEETGAGDDKGNVMSQKGFRVIKQVK
jgi:hypothetical protein